MDLTNALRLGSTPRVAIVGGGGKTTTLFILAREATSNVIVAATAHMAIAQLEMADLGSQRLSTSDRRHLLQRPREQHRQNDRLER